MNILKKIALSLLMTVVLFSVFVFIGYTGLFLMLETKFYNKHVEQIYREQVQSEVNEINAYVKENKIRFRTVLDDLDIQKFILHNGMKNIF